MDNLKYLPPDRDFSDAGNAAVFANLHKTDLAYNKSFGWIGYDVKVWQTDAEEAALKAAENFTESMRQEAEKLYRSAKDAVVQLEVAEQRDADALKKAESAAKHAKEYFNHAKRSRDGHRIREILSLSKADLVKPASMFDAEPFLLNTPAGVVDLRSGKLLKHSPLFYMTKMTAVSPSDQGMEKWMEHLNRTCGGDLEMIKGIQLLCGSTLIGKVLREGLDFLHGDGGTGKSTTFNAFRRVLGTYARSFDVNAFVATNNDDAAKRTAAHLCGARLALSGELERGKQLSESALKRLTSKDEVYGEHKYFRGFDFTPTFHVMLYTNHLPRIRSFDNGTWRRVRVWPFRHTVPKSMDNPDFEDILVKECGGAILLWAIQGAVEFYNNGCKFDLPEAVKEATERYRRNMIWNAPFLECDRVDTSNPNARARAEELYKVYTSWASTETTNSAAYNNKEFVGAMLASGFTHGRDKHGNYWGGISIVDVQPVPVSVDDLEIL